MYIVITTQYRENYGDLESPHWKNKGGSIYRINLGNLDHLDLIEVDDLISQVGDFVEHFYCLNQEGWTEEYIVDMDIMGDHEYQSWVEGETEKAAEDLVFGDSYLQFLIGKEISFDYDATPVYA